MADGIWLEVSRVRIEGADVDVQVAGDMKDDGRPEWWRVQKNALGQEPGPPTFNTIAKGLDSSEQMVIAKLGPKPTKLHLVCTTLRIQTK